MLSSLSLIPTPLSTPPLCILLILAQNLFSLLQSHHSRPYQFLHSVHNSSWTFVSLSAISLCTGYLLSLFIIPPQLLIQEHIGCFFLLSYCCLNDSIHFKKLISMAEIQFCDGGIASVQFVWVWATVLLSDPDSCNTRWFKHCLQILRVYSWDKNKLCDSWT